MGVHEERFGTFVYKRLCELCGPRWLEVSYYLVKHSSSNATDVLG